MRGRRNERKEGDAGPIAINGGILGFELRSLWSQDRYKNACGGRVVISLGVKKSTFVEPIGSGLNSSSPGGSRRIIINGVIWRSMAHE